jgi:hypothetical protein
LKKGGDDDYYYFDGSSFGVLSVYMNGNAFDNAKHVMDHSDNTPEEATAVNNDNYIPKAVNSASTL